MIDTPNLVLSANWETSEALRERGVESMLWEDCFSKDDLLSLHRKVKSFCHTWYLNGDGRDVSVADGMSFGHAISYFMYYDLESWIRVFRFFDHIYTSRIKTTFYLPNRNYFPETVYSVCNKMAREHGEWVEFKCDHGGSARLESNVSHVLGCNRCWLGLPRRRYSWLFSLVGAIRSWLEPRAAGRHIRCLVIDMRNESEYLDEFSRLGHQGKMVLYFDKRFARARLMGRSALRRGVRIVSGTLPSDNDKVVPLGGLQKTAQDALRKSICKLQLFGGAATPAFLEICTRYVEKAFEAQFSKYWYLRSIVEKHGITATISCGHDSPESYFAKHLMSRSGGMSYFLPHGLVYRDAQTYPGREDLSDHFFCYSEAERVAWRECYNLDGATFHPIRFLSERRKKNRDTACAGDASVLILLDNFQVSLASRINTFRSYIELHHLLTRLGFRNITVRPHPAFYNHYGSHEIDPEDQKKYFLSAKIQTHFDSNLANVIGTYDLVIGPLTTCVYEAMNSLVPFIPYIPDYFPSSELADVVRYQWLAGLFPAPCRGAGELEETLRDYAGDAVSYERKYRESISKVGLYDSATIPGLWSRVIEDSRAASSGSYRRGRVV